MSVSSARSDRRRRRAIGSSSTISVRTRAASLAMRLTMIRDFDHHPRAGRLPLRDIDALLGAVQMRQARLESLEADAAACVRGGRVADADAIVLDGQTQAPV